MLKIKRYKKENKKESNILNQKKTLKTKKANNTLKNIEENKKIEQPKEVRKEIKIKDSFYNKFYIQKIYNKYNVYLDNHYFLFSESTLKSAIEKIKDYINKYRTYEKLEKKIKKIGYGATPKVPLSPSEEEKRQKEFLKSAITLNKDNILNMKFNNKDLDFLLKNENKKVLNKNEFTKKFLCVQKVKNSDNITKHLSIEEIREMYKNPDIEEDNFNDDILEDEIIDSENLEEVI